MKKKLLILFLSVISVICLAMGISACRVENSSEHSHNLVKTEATDATCTEDGNIEYWYCEDCGGYFIDSYGTNQITFNDTVIAKSGHVCEGYFCDDYGHWQVCTVCGEKTESVAHSIENGICLICDFVEGLEYTLSTDGTYYSVSGIGSVSSTTVNIPETYGGFPVKKIEANAFSENTAIIVVVISYNITSIGNSAFKDCTSLKKVTIGDGVTNVGDYAFYGCSALEQITFGSNVKTIGNYSFADCAKLTSVAIGDSVTFIGDYTFSDCVSLYELTFGSALKAIGEYAFYECTSLTEITIPENVTYIGGYAFANCRYILIVIITGSPTFGNGAFEGCTLITDLTLSDKLLENIYDIINSVFPDSALLTEVKGSGGDTIHAHKLTHTDKVDATCAKEGNVEYWYCSVCNKYFSDGNGSNQITIITIEVTDHNYEAVVTEPTCVEQGYTTYTCADCGYIYVDSYTDPDGHSYNADGVCKNCGKEAVTSEGLKYTLSDDEKYYVVSGIGDCADTDVVIPGVYNNLPVTRIEDEAFYGNTSITSVFISKNITYIGSSAFYGCTSLVTIIIGEDVTTIANYAFYECTALTKIDIYATELEDLSSNNYVFYNAGKDVSGVAVTIGANVTKIPDYLFCSASFAVYMPNIISINFEDGSMCQSIGDHAFFNCTSIANITMGSGNTTYKSIDGNLYSYDGTVLILYAVGKTDSSFTIPDGVTTINNYAFYGCTNLRKLTVPGSVTAIGSDAFNSCSSLAAVYYTGTASQWADISFGSSSANPFYYADHFYLNGVLATDITIENISVIKAYAFYSCESIKSVTIGDGVASIANNAFGNCTSLISVDIGKDLTFIVGEAFNGCTSLNT